MAGMAVIVAVPAGTVAAARAGMAVAAIMAAAASTVEAVASMAAVVAVSTAVGAVASTVVVAVMAAVAAMGVITDPSKRGAGRKAPHRQEWRIERAAAFACRAFSLALYSIGWRPAARHAQGTGYPAAPH
jgi:hypothetical protein